MSPTDMTEQGLETLIVESLTGRRELVPGGMTPREAGFQREAGYLGEQFYVQGDPKDYDREYAIDLVQFLAFLNDTQPEVVKALGISSEGPSRTRVLHRIQGEIAKRGVIDVRSASRIGYSDLGVNRKRVEALRSVLIDEGVLR